MFQKKRSFFLAFVCVGMCAFFTYEKKTALPANQAPIVNVYNWYGMMDPQVLKDFQKETGIRVILDLFDNNETVETKLISGRSGYDVVFPTAFPYVERLARGKALLPLDMSKLSHARDIDPHLLREMNRIDPGNVYAIPYFWGTLGIAFNVSEMKKRLGEKYPKTSALLFDPHIVKKFASCGVTLLEEAVDVYPNVLRYLKNTKSAHDISALEDAQTLLLTLRPYITRFSSTRFTTELISGETCLAQAWSGDVHMAIEQGRSLNPPIDIAYIIPEDGASLWIDTMVIPCDAPHIDNAHRFINFLLRPDIAARVTNYVKVATCVQMSRPLVEKEIADNETIFPKPEMMEKLTLDHIQTQAYESKRNRAWTDIKTHSAR